MPFFRQKIYFITDPAVSGLSHPMQVHHLLLGGAALIQIRDKDANSRSLFEAAKQAIGLARRTGTRIIINDRVDIALSTGADGVHLGQDDLPPREARMMLGKNAIIGLSTHNVEQAAAGTIEPIDYIAIGPIFRTETKTSIDPVVGLDGLRAVRQVVGDLPLVAIGGINATNLKSVLQAGADSAAIISAVLKPGQTIVQNTKSILAVCSTL